jgi:hypothetical protein
MAVVRVRKSLQLEYYGAFRGGRTGGAEIASHVNLKFAA